MKEEPNNLAEFEQKDLTSPEGSAGALAEEEDPGPTQEQAGVSKDGSMTSSTHVQLQM